MTKDQHVLNAHQALIYTMVVAAAAEGKMKNIELAAIGNVVKGLPAFKGFDTEKLVRHAEDCANLVNQDNGMETVIALIKDALSPNLRETAYALAVDVVAADGIATQEELRLLEILRHRLDIDRLIAAGIERGARARFQQVH